MLPSLSKRCSDSVQALDGYYIAGNPLYKGGGFEFLKFS